MLANFRKCIKEQPMQVLNGSEKMLEDNTSEHLQVQNGGGGSWIS